MQYIAFLVSQYLPRWFLNSKNLIVLTSGQWALSPALTVVCLGLNFYGQQCNLCHAKAIKLYSFEQ